jgi:hypothetical protein
MTTNIEPSMNKNIVTLIQASLLLSYILICIYSYPLFFEYVYPLTHSTHFAFCTTLFCLYNVTVDLIDSPRHIASTSALINQGAALSQDAYKVMYRLVGHNVGAIGLLSVTMTYVLFMVTQTQFSFLQGMFFFITPVFLLGAAITGTIKLIKSIGAKHKWLVFTIVSAAVLGYFALLDVLEYLLGISALIHPQHSILGLLAIIGSLLIMAAGLALGLLGIWHFVGRLLNRNSDVLHIMRTNQRNLKIVKGQHYLLLLFGNSAFTLNLLLLPLYFYSLLTFHTQSTLVILIVAINLPFLIKIARLLEPLSKEFFFVMFKSVISTLVVVTFASHVIYLIAYVAFFEFRELLNALNWNMQDGVFPNFMFYFVSQPIQLNFLLAYIEGIIYAIFFSTIIVWLYAIFIRKEQYRFLWFLITAGIFGATVYYDNNITPSDVAAIVPWTMPPEIFIFTALPFLVHFVINVVAGPYRINCKCNACGFKAPKLATHCPSCGCFLHVSKPMMLGLVKAFHQPKQHFNTTEDEVNPEQQNKIIYKQQGVAQVIKCLGLLKKVQKFDLAHDLKTKRA